MGITSSPSGRLYKQSFLLLSTCNFNNSKVTRSIPLPDKQPLLCNHMPVLYNNTIAQLLGILPSHRQRDCPCRHCACLCHWRKSTTESYTTKKDHPGGHSPSPPRRRSRSERLRESPTEKKTKERLWQCKQLAHGRLIQDATAQPPTSPTNLEEEERANLKKKTAKKRSLTTPQETQNLQNTHASTKSRKRELYLESGNSPYRIKSWLTQLPQNNKQNPWLVTSQDPPDGRGPEQTASRSRQPIRTHSREEI